MYVLVLLGTTMAAVLRELNDVDDWMREWQSFEVNLQKMRDEQYKRLLNITDEYCKAQQNLQKNVDMQNKNLKAFETSFKRIQKTSSAMDGDATEQVWA